ncbi:MAG: GNAT family N-acetyltransferase [Dehalococcoidia bacterium]
MENSRLRLIENGEEPRLAQSMSRAFFDDPMTLYIMPDTEKRTKINNWLYTKIIQYCRKWGVVYTDENQVCASVWLKPGDTTMSPIRIIRAGMWQMPFRLGLKGFSRFGRLDAAASKSRKKIVPGDHWYLLMLGVDPDQQKSGLGTEALEIGATQAAAAGLPVFLETMTETNVEYYMKRGFEVGDESEVEDQVHIWSMIRKP